LYIKGGEETLIETYEEHRKNALAGTCKGCGGPTITVSTEECNNCWTKRLRLSWYEPQVYGEDVPDRRINKLNRREIK